jgi:Pregnancy-associated plasma protein-A
MGTEPSRRETAEGRTGTEDVAPPLTRRRCATIENYFRLLDVFPELRFRQTTLEGFTRTFRDSGRANRRTGPLTISVVVHVVYRTDVENISEDQVRSQINVLNQDFMATNTDLSKVPSPFQGLIGNPQIQFQLAEIRRQQTDQRSFGVNDTVKSSATGGSNPIDPSKNLNIWVCTLGQSLLGYAQFPGGPPETDGVVILNRAFGTRGTVVAPFDKGRTATHEIGHYLNLSHIWGESRFNNCTDSDSVDDTPNQFGPNTGKPAFPLISCSGSQNGDMFMNYMDYVDDDSMFMFTQGQVVRMLATLESERAELVSAMPNV